MTQTVGSTKGEESQTEKSYRLSTQQLLSIYNDQIFPEYVQGKPSLINPRFVVICAQPGAGKSRLSQSIRDAFSQAAEAAVHVDVDLLRTYHEKIDQIVSDDPMNMDQHTGYEAWMWKGYIMQDASDARNNIVMEVTLRTVEETQKRIGFYKSQNYSVDLHAMAVHESISRFGIFKRFETQIAVGETPRRVDLSFHDEACASLPSNVGILEAQCALDICAVHTRSGDILYHRKGQEGEPRAREAILIERERAWTVNDSLKHITDWRNLALQVQARPNGSLKEAFYMNELQQAIMMGISHPQLRLPLPAKEQNVQGPVAKPNFG